MTPLQRLAPRRPKSRARVAELLAAARSVFAEQGYQRATTAQIAERAGVSEATVFTYFPGKRELCVQVITNWYDELTRQIEAEMPRLHGVHAKLSYVVHLHLVSLLSEGPGLCALVLGEARTAEPELAQLIESCKQRYAAPLMNCLARAQESGEVRADMPLPLLSNLIYGSMEHAVWDAIATPHLDLDEAAELITSLLWSALLPREASLDALARFRHEVSEALRHIDLLPGAANAGAALRAGSHGAGHGTGVGGGSGVGGGGGGSSGAGGRSRTARRPNAAER